MMKQTTPDLPQMLSEFNRSLMLISDKSLLIDNFISRIKQLFDVDGVRLFLLDQSTDRYAQHRPDESSRVTFHAKERLIHWLAVNDKELIVSKHREVIEYLPPEEQKKIELLKAELIYPLKVMNHISGAVFLEKKIDGNTFSSDEVKLLSLIFNQAAFAIEHASLYEMQRERIRKMYRADRLATLGTLAAGAAHEIRNPLTSIRSAIQYLSKDFHHDSTKSELFATIINEVERINKIVQGLLSFARPSSLNIVKIDLKLLVNNVLTLINSSIQKHHIDVRCLYLTEEVTIEGDTEQMKQVFLNIFLNAIEAMKDNRETLPRQLTITIEKGVAIDTDRNYLIIKIEDTGYGIEADAIENIFNPFFTTKKEGTGLGLAISYGMINHHKGEIEVNSEPGKGSVFCIKMPQRTRYHTNT